MSAIIRALSRIIPTVHAPSAPPGQPGGAPAQGGLFAPQGALRTAYRQVVPEPIRAGARMATQQLGTMGRDIITGFRTPEGALGAGTVTDPTFIPKTFGDTIIRATPGVEARQPTGADMRLEAFPQTQLPSPSQPTTTSVEAINRALNATPGFTARPPTPIRPMQEAPTPAPIGTGQRAPIMTPATAPMPSALPPTPALRGGGGFGGVNVPTEAMLPPTPVLPGEIGREQAPIGQFEAMIRALQQQQGSPRFIQMPGVGARPFGPAGDQGQALRRLRDRELAGII